MGYSINHDSNQNNQNKDSLKLFKELLSSTSIEEMVNFFKDPLLMLKIALHFKINNPQDFIEHLKSELRNDIISIAVVEIIPELKDVINIKDKYAIDKYLTENNYRISLFSLNEKYFAYPALGCIYHKDIPIYFFDFL